VCKVGGNNPNKKAKTLVSSELFEGGPVFVPPLPAVVCKVCHQYIKRFIRRQYFIAAYHF